MKQIVAGLLAAVVMFPAVAGAQIKTLPGESLTVTATVDAIEHASRSLTLRKPATPYPTSGAEGTTCGRPLKSVTR